MRPGCSGSGLRRLVQSVSDGLIAGTRILNMPDPGSQMDAAIFSSVNARHSPLLIYSISLNNHGARLFGQSCLVRQRLTAHDFQQVPGNHIDVQEVQSPVFQNATTANHLAGNVLGSLVIHPGCKHHRKV